MLKYAILGVTAALLGGLLTPLVRRLGLRLGAVDAPGGRRIHTGRIPRLGGLAVFAALVGSIAAGYVADRLLMDVYHGYGWAWGWLLAGALVVVTAGVIDDVWSLGPVPKLGFQLLAGTMVLAGSCGIHTISNPLTGGGIELGWLAVPATLVWVVGITNAFNLIDGLDGLAAGVALIAAGTLLVVSLAAGRVDVALLSVAVGGALLGFLYYNFNPASIFLGDSGSLLLGYLLSVLSIQSAQKGTTAVVILVPILALGLPIMDTVLAMVRRLLRALRVVQSDPEHNEYRFFVTGSASIFRADREHIHHRLLALGLTHRRAVWLLYGVSVVLGLMAFLAVVARGTHVALLVAVVALATYAGIRKLGYHEVELLRRGTLLPLFELPVLNRRLFHVLVDIGFIAAAYVGAFVAVLDGTLDATTRAYILRTIVIVVALKLAVFVYAGLYRRAYRYSDAGDVIGLAKALAGAELAAAGAVALLAGAPRYAAALLPLDFYLTASLIAGTRLSFKILEVLAHSRSAPQARDVLIYGAGNGGSAVLHELLQHPTLGYHVVGFVDDFFRLWGREVNGVPVLGGPEQLPALIRQHHVHEVIVASPSTSAQRIGEVARACAVAGAQVRRFRFALEPLDARPHTVEPGPVAPEIGR